MNTPGDRSMDPTLEPFSERARALIDADRPEQPATAAVRARVWASLAAQLAVPSAPQAPLDKAGQAGNPTKAAGKGLSASLGRFTVGHALLTGAAIFGMGVGLGTFATRTWMPPTVKAVTVPAEPAPAMPIIRPLPPAPAVVPVPSPSLTPPAKAPARSVERAAPSARDPHERDSIDQALKALGREDPAAAMVALNQHATDFPRGQLAEEREALRVRALMAMGRHEEAKRVAKAFDETFPGSLLRPSVRAALDQTLP